jgi:hypothetical protein
VSTAAGSNAERYLRELQRSAWEANPPPPGSDLWQAVEAKRALRARIAAEPSFADEFRRRMSAGGADDASQTDALIEGRERDHEDPFAYRVIREAAADVEEALAELGKRHGPVVVGTARTRRVNALAFAPEPGPEAARVVVIDGGLLPFLADIAFLVARVLPTSRGADLGFSLEPEQVREHLAASRGIVERAADDVARFVTGGYPLEQVVDDDPADEDARPLASVLYRLLAVFVVGHEYSHVHLGHMKERRTTTARLPGVADLPVAEIVEDWFLESEADAGGVEVTIRVGQRYGVQPAIAFLACNLFFCGAQIVEIGELIRATGSLERAVDEYARIEQLALEDSRAVAPLRSHPPPLLRRKAVRQIIRGSTTPETFDAVTGATRQFDAAYGVILEHVLPALEARLAPR